MKWFLICKTCQAQVSVATERQAQWELKYHESCYKGHEATVTSPKSKRKSNGKRDERAAEEAGTTESTG